MYYKYYIYYPEPHPQKPPMLIDRFFTFTSVSVFRGQVICIWRSSKVYLGVKKTVFRGQVKSTCIEAPKQVISAGFWLLFTRHFVMYLHKIIAKKSVLALYKV